MKRLLLTLLLASAAALSATVAQAGTTPCGTYNGRGCAPLSSRVDLATPKFSHSMQITNPLYPISGLDSVVFLGHVGKEPFRTETTLLPGTETVLWNGHRVRVLISQYTAYVNRRLDEVALDRYAQADDGSVWYLGEDVFDYRKGAIALTEGTWLAGREGPAAMIMPAHPKRGDVFRTENAPGIVFEEVTVKQTGKTVPGPDGPIRGAIVGSELHTDGTREDKIFAPGYGEFRTEGGGDLEALALAVPTNARRGPMPAELTTLSKGANGILESARVGDWAAASATLRYVRSAWQTLHDGKEPPLIAARMNVAVDALAHAVRAHKALAAEQAAIDVTQSGLDLELQYRPPVQIDAARFELRTQQLRLDAAKSNLADVTGDVAVLEWMRYRFAHTLRAADRREIDERLVNLRAATDARNLPAAADHAARLGARLRHFIAG